MASRARSTTRPQYLLSKLREVQPHGPYVLVGWSFGGALAYGVLAALREAGEEIKVHQPHRRGAAQEDLVETPESKRERLEQWKDFAIRNYDLDADADP